MKELKKDIEIDAREINAVHNELARKVDEIKELKIKLRNCVSPEVLRLNKLENSNRFDKHIKVIKKGL